MQYPIFLSPTDVARLLGMGRTFVFARISDGEFTAVKFGSSTRITFSSVIEYAQRCLKEGNGKGTILETFGERGSVDACVLVEHFARLLCNTHSERITYFAAQDLKVLPATISHDEANSTDENFGGEL
ncbi:helix-turn-helix domain-containing protein [Altererythrobacter sp.]|nr:helix-turn-helix domain-containing protein [Altererythrobacter sp.]